MKIITFKSVMLLLVTMLLCSCYSIRLVSTEGAPQKDPFSERDDRYRDLQVIQKDTVIRVNITTGGFDYLVKKEKFCKSGKLHLLNSFQFIAMIRIIAIKRKKLKISKFLTKFTLASAPKGRVNPRIRL